MKPVTPDLKSLRRLTHKSHIRHIRSVFAPFGVETKWLGPASCVVMVEASDPQALARAVHTLSPTHTH